MPSNLKDRHNLIPSASLGLQCQSAPTISSLCYSVICQVFSRSMQRIAFCVSHLISTEAYSYGVFVLAGNQHIQRAEKLWEEALTRSAIELSGQQVLCQWITHQGIPHCSGIPRHPQSMITCKFLPDCENQAKIVLHCEHSLFSSICLVGRH